MGKKSGSINLAEVRIITGIVPLRGKFTVQMLSENLSGNTTFNLQFSCDGENYWNATDAGEAITGTLVDDTVLGVSYEGDPGLNFKILFAGVTTGTVDYVINGV